jgi:hypothetical protein
MPSSEVMGLFRAHKLHSGKGGKIVKKKSQAKAILLSYLRKEGKDIPMKRRRKLGEK